VNAILNISVVTIVEVVAELYSTSIEKAYYIGYFGPITSVFSPMW